MMVPLHFVPVWIFDIYYFLLKISFISCYARRKSVHEDGSVGFKAGICILSLRTFWFLCWHLIENRRVLCWGWCRTLGVVLSCNWIDGKSTNPYMLWSQEFLTWCRRTGPNFRYVRHIPGFWWCQYFGVFIGNPTYLKSTFGQSIHDQPTSTS